MAINTCFSLFLCAVTDFIHLSSNSTKKNSNIANNTPRVSEYTIYTKKTNGIWWKIVNNSIQSTSIELKYRWSALSPTAKNQISVNMQPSDFDVFRSVRCNKSEKEIKLIRKCHGYGAVELYVQCTCISYRSDTKSNYTTDESEISVKTTCVCRCGFWRQMNDDKISSVWHICIWVFLCVNFISCFSCELVYCAQCVKWSGNSLPLNIADRRILCTKHTTHELKNNLLIDFVSCFIFNLHSLQINRFFWLR